MNTTITLLCGSTAAGKTTYGRALAERTSGLLFTVDAWMSALFWMDAAQPIEPAWAIERVDRCVGLIWHTAAALARTGVHPVLEIGLTTRASRERIARWAARDDVPIALHLLDLPAEERWRRVQARNEPRSDDAELAFAITRDHFDFVEAIWEAPGADEMTRLEGVRVAG